MKQVLLTGVSGFIGFHVAVTLSQNGVKVIAPYRTNSLSSIKIKNLKDRGVILSESIFYDNNYLNNLPQAIDAILHFAAVRGEGAAKADIYENINIKATEILLDFALMSKIPRFLYCSTVGVLGTIPKSVPAHETDRPAPDNKYHKTKFESEKMILAAHSKELNTCIIRPTITYGKYDNGFLVRLISMIKSKKMIISTKKSFIHLLSVQALAELVSAIIQQSLFDGKIYQLADKKPVLFKELCDLLVKHTNGNYIAINNTFFKLGELFFYLTSNRKMLTSLKLIGESWTYSTEQAIQYLGFQPKDTFTEIEKLLFQNGN